MRLVSLALTSLVHRQEPQDLTAKGQMMRTLSGPGPEFHGDGLEDGRSPVAFFPQNWHERLRSSFHNPSSVIEVIGRGMTGKYARRTAAQT